MANFETHLTFAAAGSGLVSIAFLGAGIATPAEAVGFWLAGTLGGVMPDIDADHSTAVKSIFTLLGLMMALLVMVVQADTYSILELWATGCIVFLLVRYPILKVFYEYTSHRGIFHSILTGIFFWFLAASVCSKIFELNSALSWTFGFFLFLGFVLHLVLDEAFSVDLSNAKVKQSFGTALELFDYSNIKTSGAMLVITVGLFFLTPDINSASDIFLNGHSFEEISNSFLPEDGWFF